LAGSRVVENTVSPLTLGEDGGGHPDRRRPAAHQQGLARLRVEADGERSVGGLQRLRSAPIVAQSRSLEIAIACATGTHVYSA
jgi:hypothetical protein